MSGVGRLVGETLRNFSERDNIKFFLYSHLPPHPDHFDLLELSWIEWVPTKKRIWNRGGIYFNFLLPFLLARENLNLFWGSQQVVPPFLSGKVQVVLTYHDLVLYFFPNTMRFLARVQQQVFQKYSVNRAAHIICNSRNTLEDCKNHFHLEDSRLSVAYPGVDLNRISASLRNPETERIERISDPFILSVSTIEPRKNYSFLLEVFRKIRETTILNGKKMKWVIAGKAGWETNEFYSILAMEQKNEDIYILENLSDSELHHLYRKASLFWMASIYEGFGIPFLEALFHTLPCIVSDIPVFREIGGNQALYLPTKTQKDVETWAQSTREILSRPGSPGTNSTSIQHKTEMALHSENFQSTEDFRKELLEKFSWKKAADHTRKKFLESIQYNRFF
jgi:glycosyltransferase involved in cell wall biosynthesis